MNQDGKSLNLKTKVLVISGWALLLERKMVALCVIPYLQKIDCIKII